MKRFELARHRSVPALVVCYAVGAFVIAALSGWWTVPSVQAGRAVAADRLCSVDPDGPCMERVTGRLSGPYSIRKSVNEEWQVSGAGGRLVVGPRASSSLQRWDGAEVTGLVFRGELAVIRTSDGARFESLEVGIRGAVMSGCFAVAALAAGIGLVRSGVRRRRASGGWWRVDDPPIDSTSLAVAAVIAVPVAVIALTTLGAPWWGGFALALGLAAVTALLRLARGRRWLRVHPPRHARGPF